MPIIHFEDDNLSVEAACGSKLIDICDQQAVSLLFGCRQANCGTCLLEVTAGHENIGEMKADEREMLEVLVPDNPRARLGCQCVIRGDVRLRVLEC